MSRNSPVPGQENSYHELLAEYATLTAEIDPLLDEFGRPERERYAAYRRLRERKAAIRSALDEASPDHETIDVDRVVNEAFSEQ